MVRQREELNGKMALIQLMKSFYSKLSLLAFEKYNTEDNLRLPTNFDILTLSGNFEVFFKSIFSVKT